MEKHELQVVIEELHERYKPLDEGQVATYIPELGKADPEAFGIALMSSEGQVFQAGDCDVPFTIQSVSKPFTFGLAIEAMAPTGWRAMSGLSQAATHSTRSNCRTERTVRSTRW